jgi:hypothetical protein
MYQKTELFHSSAVKPAVNDLLFNALEPTYLVALSKPNLVLVSWEYVDAHSVMMMMMIIIIIII